MQPLLPKLEGFRIVTQKGRLDTKAIAQVDQLVLVLPERPGDAVFRRIPGGKKLKAALRRNRAGSVPAAVTRADNARQTLVVIGTIKPGGETFERLTWARKLVAAATTEKAGALGIAIQGFDEDAESALLDALLAAALAAGAPVPEWKKKASPRKIRSIRLLGLDERPALERVRAEARGNFLARWLTMLPPNKLDAAAYTDIAKTLADDHGWEFRRFGIAELEELGAGAFLAVAQGNADDDAGIVRLRYRPDDTDAAPRVALVGKGIIFDTGGTNLKPFNSMLDMHGDMQGSAVALGTLLALSDLRVPFAIDCWLAITENRTGPTAYKSQDLVTALNGKTIQTIHTDAEGRMALADALTMATRENPGLVIDYATLTGSCIDAITTRYAGVFTNRPDWHPRLKRTGRAAGERVWPFPIGGEFLEELESPVADLMQCTVKGTGDHIYAASFLGEFIENDTPWLHVDLSAGEHDGGLAHIPTKVTGFGVRLTLALLLDEKIGESG
jgi:leucyl aminopeptidase